VVCGNEEDAALEMKIKLVFKAKSQI
jgi:hypothetical protein